MFDQYPCTTDPFVVLLLFIRQFRFRVVLGLSFSLDGLVQLGNREILFDTKVTKIHIDFKKPEPVTFAPVPAEFLFEEFVIVHRALCRQAQKDYKAP